MNSNLPGVISPPVPEPAPQEAEPDDAMALRAFRAAVIGLLICPPLLNFYSAWLLLRISIDERPLSARGIRLCRWALLLNIAACLAGGIGMPMIFMW